MCFFPAAGEKQSHASGQTGDPLQRKVTESSAEGHLDVQLGFIGPGQIHTSSTHLAPGVSALVVFLVMAPRQLPDLEGG